MSFEMFTLGRTSSSEQDPLSRSGLQPRPTACVRTMVSPSVEFVHRRATDHRSGGLETAAASRRLYDYLELVLC